MSDGFFSKERDNDQKQSVVLRDMYDEFVSRTKKMYDNDNDF